MIITLQNHLFYSSKSKLAPIRTGEIIKIICEVLQYVLSKYMMIWIEDRKHVFNVLISITKKSWN